MAFNPAGRKYSGWHGYQQYNRDKARWDASEKKKATDRTVAMEDKQMELLDAQIASMGGQYNENVKAAADKEASEYLGKWNTALSGAEGVYSDAVSEMGKAGQLIDRAYGDLDKLDDVGADMETEWNQFKTDFGSMQKDFLAEGKAGLADRGTLRRSYMDMAKGDIEGESSRAMTDVAGKAEAGRKAEAMRLQGLGIDPTSGRSRSLMRSSRDQEAFSKVAAGNQARRLEKDRVAGITARGLDLIDPSKDVSAAGQIQSISSNLLGQRSNMATTKAGLSSDLARSRVNVGTGMVTAGRGRSEIAGQYGGYGAAQRGVAQANTAPQGAAGGGISYRSGGGMVFDGTATASERSAAFGDRVQAYNNRKRQEYLNS